MEANGLVSNTTIIGLHSYGVGDIHKIHHFKLKYSSPGIVGYWKLHHPKGTDFEKYLPFSVTELF